MSAIRGLSAAAGAEPLWCWGEKRWTTLSVCLAALTQSAACVRVKMHASSVERGCMFSFYICGFASVLSPQNGVSHTFLQFTVFLSLSGTLHPHDRHPTRKGRNGWGPTQQGGFRIQAASPRCLPLELRAQPLENIITPTCVGLQNKHVGIRYDPVNTEL